MENLIEVNGLYSEISDKLVLNDVSFQVRSGEITAILGSSGSEKPQY